MRPVENMCARLRVHRVNARRAPPGAERAQLTAGAVKRSVSSLLLACPGGGDDRWPGESSASADARGRLERRARLLAWGGNAWHVVEFAIALGAGVAAGSIALIGFGFDSLIEAGSGLVIVWLAAVAGREGVESWRGDHCDCC